MIAHEGNVIDLLAQTLCASFHSDSGAAVAWDSLSPLQQGNWRRTAQCALRTINGNRHWMPEGGRLQ